MRKDAIDETGNKYGKWIVIGNSRLSNNKRNREWLCRCACGKEAYIIGTSLRSGQSNGCSVCRDSTKRIKELRKKLKGKPRADRKSDPTYGDFWSKVEKTANCWNWIGADVGRYGQWGGGITRYGERLAHRVSYIMHKGSIPDNMEVMHTCDNGFCVNPDHLIIGTHADNMKDASNKGRARSKTGPRVTHCSRGHEYTEDNTYYSYGKKKRRTCKICHKLRKKGNKE